MTVARRYILLQRIVWAQSAFCIALSLYCLFSSKKQFPLNLTVSEAPALDLSFLDGITNTPRRAVGAGAPTPPAPVAEGLGATAPTSPRRLPFRFDGYSVVDGFPCVVVDGKRVLREGATVHGRKIESISPLGVIVDGEWYDYTPKKEGSVNLHES